MSKEVILAELKKILTNAQAKLQNKSMDLYMKDDFSMEPNAPIGESLPATNLRVQNARLRGQDLQDIDKRFWWCN